MATLSPPRPPPGAVRAPAPPPPAKVPRWQRPAGRAAASDDLATLCLLLVTLAASAGFIRLFTDWTFLPYAVGATILGHCTAWGLRRLGAGLAIASFAAGIGSAVYAIWLVSPDDTFHGFIIPATIERTGADLAAAQEVFHNAVAPVEPLRGFLLAIALGTCLVAFLSDWAAFRMRASFEAVVPAYAIFVVTAIFGTSEYRTASVAAIASTSLLFLVVHRAALDAERGTWFGNRSIGALPSLLATGAVIGAVALAGALVVGPRIPGATSKALVHWRNDGGGGNGGSRSTISPLVDIRGRLVNPTDAEVFRVRADRDEYWRLTSLDRFDGQIWSSNERYRQTRGTLVPDSELIGTPLRQQVTIGSLASIWLPGAYRPQHIDGPKGVSYSARSSSLISREDTSDGLTYELVSVVPDASPALLRTAPPSVSGSSGLGLELGDLTSKPKVDRRVQALVTRITAGKPTAFDKARAIQDHLRTFTYDLHVRQGHSADVLTQFLLVDRRGYCEQFAGAFAVLARLVGLPARVAVGFQPGIRTADGIFQVRDKDAHAWPEVYFEGVGWMPFEPTPGGTGNPAASGYSDVPYVPRAPAGTDNAPAGSIPDSPASPSGPTSTTIPKDEKDASSSPAQQDEDNRGLLVVFLVLSGVVLVVGGALGACYLVANGLRTRRRRAATTPAARIDLAWLEAEEALGLVRVTRRRTMTIDEWLERLSRPAGGAASAGVERGTAGHQALHRLGAAVVDAAYGGPAVSSEVATKAEADSAVVVASAHAAAGPWTVLLWQLDPRPALAALAARRASARPAPAAPRTNA